MATKHSAAIAWQLLLLLLLLIMSTSHHCNGCYLNLMQSSTSSNPKSIEDLAELAPIVLTGQVLDTTKSDRTKQRSYSASVRVVEVLKGLAMLDGNGTSSSSISGRIFLVDGFGSPIACLSEVAANDWLVFFLSGGRQQRLLAHYASPSAAVAQLTDSNLASVRNVLGWLSWSNWTRCSSDCGPDGQRERLRHCAGPPCDYGQNRQTADCNRWPCDVMQPAQIQQPTDNSGNSTLVDLAAFKVTVSTFANNTALALTLSELKDEAHLAIETLANETIVIISKKRSNSIRPSLFLTMQSTMSNETLVNYSIDCIESGSVSIEANSVSKIIFSPGRAVLKAHLVPWSLATDCSRTKQLTPPPTYWTDWSPCSATCGEGTRTRHSVCRHDLPASPTSDRCSTRPDARPPAESLPCPSLPLCNPDRGGRPSVEQDPLHQPESSCSCLNGGFCVESRCLCPTTHAGDRCQEAVLLQAKPANQLPSNQPPLTNRQDRQFDCRLGRRDGRRRRSRSRGNKAVCRNGGICDPRNGACRCPMGWSGRRCRKPQCRPKCKNGGACVQPNLCACPEGFAGTQCQIVECYPPCLNGGSCIRPGKCSCPKGYRGRYCHRVRCHPGLCLNGGRCLESDGLCRCVAGFYGPRCERRSCTPELNYRKIYRPVVKRLRRPAVQPCSPGSKRYCVRTSWSRVVVFKIILRPYFACPTV